MKDLWIRVKDKLPEVEEKQMFFASKPLLTLLNINGKIVTCTAIFSKSWRGNRWNALEEPYYSVGEFVTHWIQIETPEEIYEKHT